MTDSPRLRATADPERGTLSALQIAPVAIKTGHIVPFPAGFLVRVESLVQKAVRIVVTGRIIPNARSEEAGIVPGTQVSSTFYAPEVAVRILEVRSAPLSTGDRLALNASDILDPGLFPRDLVVAFPGTAPVAYRRVQRKLEGLKEVQYRASVSGEGLDLVIFNDHATSG